MGGEYNLQSTGLHCPMDPTAALDVKDFQETRKLLAKMVLVIAAVSTWSKFGSSPLCNNFDKVFSLF